jgi:hypothetical protein
VGYITNSARNSLTDWGEGLARLWSSAKRVGAYGAGQTWLKAVEGTGGLLFQRDAVGVNRI